MPKVLLVEDDANLSASVVRVLEGEKWTVELSPDGKDAQHRLSVYGYDLVIMDWQLPGVSGVELCQEFRSRGGSTPILMLTGRGTIADKEEGFDAGADDYLTKPFDARELLMRVKALLRRTAAVTAQIIKCGDLVIDSSRRSVSRNGKEIALQPMEYTVLELLIRHPNQVFSAEALLKRCWTADVEASTFAVYTCIRRLRRKLDVPEQRSIVKTIANVGYVFEPDD